MTTKHSIRAVPYACPALLNDRYKKATGSPRFLAVFIVIRKVACH